MAMLDAPLQSLASQAYILDISCYQLRLRTRPLANRSRYNP